MATVDNLHLGAAGEPVPHAQYVRLSATERGGRFRSTLHSQGAWQPGEQHMAPASGLLIHEIERVLPGDKAISRMSFDILGVILSGEFEVVVDVVRPGRTIELVEARMVHGERTSVVARVWRLIASDTSAIAGTPIESIPSWDECEHFPMADLWPGGAIASVEVRSAAGREPGRAVAWVDVPVPIVDGEDDAPAAALAKVADIANGLAVREDPEQVFFANVDLGIHVMRAPEPGPIGFDVRVSFGPDGLGVTQAILHDARGPVAATSQSLTVRAGSGVTS